MDIEEEKMSILDYQNSISEDLLWICDLEQDIIEGYKLVFNVRDINYLYANPTAKIFYQFEENGKTYFFLEEDYHFPSQSMIDTVFQVANLHKYSIGKLKESIEISKRKIRELEATT